jgi:hypothetical protein
MWSDYETCGRMNLSDYLTAECKSKIIEILPERHEPVYDRIDLKFWLSASSLPCKPFNTLLDSIDEIRKPFIKHMSLADPEPSDHAPSDAASTRFNEKYKTEDMLNYYDRITLPITWPTYRDLFISLHHLKDMQLSEETSRAIRALLGYNVLQIRTLRCILRQHTSSK